MVPIHKEAGKLVHGIRSGKAFFVQTFWMDFQPWGCAVLPSATRKSWWSLVLHEGQDRGKHNQPGVDRALTKD